ncbi:hypothetical protein RvY_04877-1 [Ramazzottius varieornatus]|uniref:Uncharacterized protein n=1 Tax=Ramazzottius varieornatus TaxID=947166 RepID=A0A1D1UWB7_RAMVA|nr:hypothetical protein RvY_04877-1 [Ramazzottius varieornatus]
MYKKSIRHVSLCELVELAEYVFSPWIFLVLGGSIIQLLISVFVAYSIGLQWTIITSLSQLFWFLTYSVQTLVVLYAGSRLYETAHGVLPHIHKIDQSRLTLSKELQIQTFLNRLTCNSIGFTAWKMFTITNEAVLGVRSFIVKHTPSSTTHLPLPDKFSMDPSIRCFILSTS